MRGIRGDCCPREKRVSSAIQGRVSTHGAATPKESEPGGADGVMGCQRQHGGRYRGSMQSRQPGSRDMQLSPRSAVCKLPAHLPGCCPAGWGSASNLGAPRQWPPARWGDPGCRQTGHWSRRRPCPAAGRAARGRRSLHALCCAKCTCAARHVAALHCRLDCTHLLKGAGATQGTSRAHVKSACAVG